MSRKDEPKHELLVPLQIARIDFEYLMTTAIEGGSNFWINAYDPKVTRFKGDKDDERHLIVTQIEYLSPFGDSDDEDEYNEPVVNKVIDVAKIIEAVRSVLSRTDGNYAGTRRALIADMPEIGGCDAIVADTILQIATFGEEVYS